MPDINMQVFEEVKRNQLVTEIDIQTQVVLDDYQVQLSDIANLTKSQDNVVIDRYGEFLPHWNESLDFDTWVKMDLEVAGKKLLLIHGNDGLSSRSNGENVFETFFDKDSISDWSKTNITVSTSGDYLRFYNGVSGNIGRATHAISMIDSKYIMESKMHTTSLGTDDTNIIELWDGSSSHRFMSGVFPRSTDQSNWYYLYPTWQYGLGGAYTEGTEYIIKYILDESGSPNANYYLLDLNRSVLSSALNKVYVYGSPIDADIISIGDATATGKCNLYAEWIIFRNYTAIEPTHSIGIEQNIALALKLLGRAG